MEQTDEIELARGLLAGRPDAFERFVEHFRTKIFNCSWLMCGDRDDAEEVAQETLLKVFENLRQLRQPERVKPWVFRIARNACLMKRRKSVYAPAHELSLEEFMPVGEIADWSNLPEDRVLQSELKEVLEKAIGELPESYRSVILLRDVEELSTLESARILEVTEDMIRTRLHRARLAVRQKLDAYLRGGRDGQS